MAQILYVTNIQLDFGAVQLLKAECERTGITHPLVVTDAGVKAAGLLERVLAALPGLSVAVSTRPPPTPPKRPCARPPWSTPHSGVTA